MVAHFCITVATIEAKRIMCSSGVGSDCMLGGPGSRDLLTKKKKRGQSTKFFGSYHHCMILLYTVHMLMVH